MEDLTGFKKWYETARFTRDAQLAFTWDIARSAYTEFHYQVMTDKLTDERFRDMLWSRFSAHGESAMKLMLAKLDSNEDPEFHPQIIFCLGLIADQQKLGKMRTLEYARKFVSATSEHLRNRAIIVLGWTGGVRDIPLPGEHLLNDPDARCRSWSATSFLQMHFRHRRSLVSDRALPLLKQAIARETDYFALGQMINVVAQLSGKKFGLSKYAIENIDEEKIDNAKVKAERYLKKLYGE